MLLEVILKITYKNRHRGGEFLENLFKREMESLRCGKGIRF